MGTREPQPAYVELRRPRKKPGESERRWFHARTADLILWLGDDGSIHGFQFCYQHDRDEHALTWMRDHGFSHMSVDSGAGRHISKGTPLLVPNGKFDADLVLSLFRAHEASLPPDFAGFVAAKIGEARS
jgi:hypothetical protein